MPTPKPELVLISASGAQATGKSTMLSALARGLISNGASVVCTPSFSSRLFERWTARKLRHAPAPVLDFDSIDAKGHREWFQTQLPESLSFEVESAVQVLRQASTRFNYLLVDRWFPDIMAHTCLGMPKDEVAHRQIRRLCQGRHAQLLSELRVAFDLLVLHVFVPVSASGFPVRGQDGKFRATTDRTAFETVCLREWSAVVGRAPDLTVSTSDLNTRVFDITTAINTARTTHASRAKSTAS